MMCALRCLRCSTRDDASNFVFWEVVMFSNRRIPLSMILAIPVIVGVGITTANAQNPAARKLVRDRIGPTIEKAAPELKAFADWLRPTWVRLEESVTAAAKNLKTKLGAGTAADPTLARPAADALAKARQPFVFEHPLQFEYRVQEVHSLFRDARPQIVGDLLKGGDLSEEGVAKIFEKSLVATAEKSASLPFEFDPTTLKIKFNYSRDIYGLVRIKPSELDLKPLVKMAGRAYLACVLAKTTNEKVKSLLSNSAAEEDCVNGTLGLLIAGIRRAIRAEPGIGTVAHAPENVD